MAQVSSPSPSDLWEYKGNSWNCESSTPENAPLSPFGSSDSASREPFLGSKRKHRNEQRHKKKLWKIFPWIHWDVWDVPGSPQEPEHLEKASPSLDPELQTGIFGIFLEIPSNQIPLEKLRSPKNLGTLMEDFSMPRKKTLEKLEIRRI